MDNAYVSAISALAGSAIGGLATFATTWLSHHAQTQAQRLAQAMARQEHLFGEFIDARRRILPRGKLLQNILNALELFA